MKFLLSFFAVCIIFLVGCEKKLEPIPVGEMNEYKDPGFGFKIKYPKEWIQLGTTGKAVFAKSQEVANKFIDPKSGEDGARVTAEVMRYDGKTIEEILTGARDNLKQSWQNIELQPDQQITVNGKPATKISYSIPVTTKTKISGYEIYIAGDTAIYKLDFVGYSDQYTAHQGVFDAILKSYELPIVVAKKSDIWQASPNFETYTSAIFTFSYPDNLIFEKPKGDKGHVVEMRTPDRLDCSIHIDAFEAKGQPIEKAWEQNKGKYKAKGTGETSIDGNKSYWVDYSPVASINSRAYFIVKNDKMIRTTINWFAPQKEVYFSALEKCVNSIKFK